MSIAQTQHTIIQEFSRLSDWFEKYEFLIQRGRELRPIENRYKNQTTALPGCQSQVWVYAEIIQDKLIFFADSDALITRGILSLLLQVFNNHSPQEIQQAQLFFLDAIGLSSSLSPSRSNGVASIVRQMQELASAYV